MNAPKRNRHAEFHFVTNYNGKGPRVIVLVGPRWTDQMRSHYKLTDQPFYRRQAIDAEPDVDASGHPWGWVSKPHEMLLDEARWSSQESMEALKLALQCEIEKHSEEYA